ncbi:uncharacterized protein C16orf90 homolog isoform X1 [Trichosurus vulpecula]|uniref:uncharacterized protein C16orf90 homolog isoform X1 n=1 Tax=Trichosurus vulpecula TaxID=9337 RepID=UPI00186AF096|nr:uncharacterized protein C16orf90 homolog isoform X1 [Trichosurus vulpecula]
MEALVCAFSELRIREGCLCFHHRCSEPDFGLPRQRRHSPQHLRGGPGGPEAAVPQPTRQQAQELPSSSPSKPGTLSAQQHATCRPVREPLAGEANGRGLPPTGGAPAQGRGMGPRSSWPSELYQPPPGFTRSPTTQGEPREYSFQLQHRPNQGCPLPAPATRGLRLQAQEVLGSLRGVNMSYVQEDPARGPEEAIGRSQAAGLVSPALGAGGGNGLRLQVPGRTASLQTLQDPPGKQPSGMPRQLRKFPRREVRLGSQGSERRGKRFSPEGRRKEKQGRWSKQPGHTLHTLLPRKWCRRQIIPVKQAWEPAGPTSE